MIGGSAASLSTEGKPNADHALRFDAEFAAAGGRRGRMIRRVFT
jgi:hypothetical protein